jgi:hypothetical protein
VYRQHVYRGGELVPNERGVPVDEQLDVRGVDANCHGLPRDGGRPVVVPLRGKGLLPDFYGGTLCTGSGSDGAQLTEKEPTEDLCLLMKAL